MAKKKSETNPAEAKNDPESVSGYFRRIFDENPKLLESRSNDELLQRWLADHPGSKEDPERLRQILSNVKSVLRKRGRRKTAAAKPQGRHLTTRAAARETPLDKLEFLEERIDDCLTIAKLMDQEGLGSVIQHLRRARNEVVWKLGQ
jgi:hypothetical protein